MLTSSDSVTGFISSLWIDSDPGDDYVNNWRADGLWYYYMFWSIFP